MRSLSVFFKQVRFVENGKNGLPCHFGEFVIVLKRLMVSGNGLAELNAETAGAGQQPPGRQHAACAGYRGRQERHLAFDRSGKSAGAESPDPSLFDERAFREKDHGLATLCGFDDLARIASTARGRESLDESRARASQQKMYERYVAHFSLDDEGKTSGQVAPHQESVNVAGVVCDDDAVPCRQILAATHLNADSGEHEQGACRGRGEPLASRQTWHKCDDEQRIQHAKEEDKPGVQPPKAVQQSCDVLHFMLTPWCFCETGHAGCEAS